jgi:hypothetical protein
MNQKTCGCLRFDFKLKHFRRYLLLSLVALALAISTSDAGAVTISHTNITAGSSSFTSADGKLTLTPFAAGGGAGTFGATSSCCIGVAGGTNGSGIDDVDGSPLTTADRERMDISLASDAVIDSIGFIFTRADGPSSTDGIVISGFASNPLATVNPASVPATYANGTLYINHGWRGGAVTTVSFAKIGATVGQTLSIASNDSTQAAPQVVINNLSYSVVPEPSTMMLAGLAAAFCRLRKIQ